MDFIVIFVMQIKPHTRINKNTHARAMHWIY